MPTVSEILARPGVIDITGERFGRLVALRPVDKKDNAGVRWFCICDCGATVTVNGCALRYGRNRSCGCLLGNTSVEIGRRKKEKSRIRHQLGLTDGGVKYTEDQYFEHRNEYISAEKRLEVSSDVGPRSIRIRREAPVDYEAKTESEVPVDEFLKGKR